MYFGTYSRNLDEKGRLQLPTKLVDKGVKTLYILKGFDGCISVYEEEGFNSLMNEIKSMNFKNEDDRVYIRLTASSVRPLDIDSHGRINLGRETLNEYRIGDNVTIIGVIDHFEIWDPTAYAMYQIKHGSTYDHLSGGVN